MTGVGYRAAAQGKTLQAGARLQPRRRFPGARGRDHHDPEADGDHRRRHRPAGRRPGRGEHPRVAQARAVQGQGHQVQGRVHLPQGREEEVRGADMANSKRDLFQKRRLRVRNKLRKMAGDRPRLSVHRSLEEHLRPADRRRPGRHPGRRLDAGAGAGPEGQEQQGSRRQGRRRDRRARQGRRRRGGLLRPRRVPVSRQGQGPCGRRP